MLGEYAGQSREALMGFFLPRERDAIPMYSTDQCTSPASRI